MKKLILIILVTIAAAASFGASYTLQKDDGNLYLAWYGVAFRAVKYYTSDTCTLNTVQWGRYTKRAEVDTILVYADNAGLPGSILYKKTLSVNTNRLMSVVSDTVIDKVLLKGTFWIGVQARTQDTPSNALSYFISDTIGDGSSFSSSDGINWVQNLTGDYIIRAVVTGPEGMITLKQDNSTLDEEIVFDSEIELNSTVISSHTPLSLSFTLQNTENVKVSLFDRSGRNIRDITTGNYDRGYNTISWDMKDNSGMEVKTGIYFISITVKNKSFIKKISLIR